MPPTLRSFPLAAACAVIVAAQGWFSLAAAAPVRMLRVAEADLRGAKDVGAFLAAAKVREATLTACLKGPSGVDQVQEIAAFLDVTPEGAVRSTSVQGAGLSDIEVDICVMEELSRVRFPAGAKPVSVVLRLRPDPKDTSADGEDSETNGAAASKSGGSRAR